MVMNAFASSVPAIRQLPFGNIVEISIVAEPEHWQAWFKARMADPADARKRVLEGCASLQWSLDHGDSMIWVCNRAGKLAETSTEIRDISLGLRDPDPHNRAIGERLLRALEAEL
jgi:hypothetical protein